MLDSKLLRTSPEIVRRALHLRRATIDLDALLALDETRRQLTTEVETLKAQRNQASQEVARKKRAGEDASALMAELGTLSQRIKELDERCSAVDAQFQEMLLTIPNIPHASVPEGSSDADNTEVRRWGIPPQFSFTPKEHWEIGALLGGLDFETAAKITGSRFVLLRGWAARLERALISFMLDVQTQEHGYQEVLPPVIVNRASLIGTGQLPKFEEDLFHLTGTDYYLIPTAEVPVTNIFRDTTLDEADLPMGLCAFTPCFRSEAGSYGKDTKGIIRQHQFHKVELVRLAHPDTSYDELELLVTHAEAILQRLGLAYRVVTLCSGDLGFSAAKTYDIEVWLPGQATYREISSCSNFEDFQARRAGIRFRPKGAKKSALVHTLNGSGLAIGRTMVAILENYQQADGTVRVPEALQPYLGGATTIPF
ncbi:serine--tRNA ligase [Thermodesulfomicrobium sp. WS]|uniref:serine--tRNA ligase n=1 Tax=Thermodesulfomicrobium sp. WS TaxID=3004129 RepID=UPI002491B83F|nr:serine--tRNA ligase [Thermodesulfomicrobium sp. WS]BDV00457.1 serine--tRNA ligase [Thermodesulfomicrobium sp. WS]